MKRGITGDTAIRLENVFQNVAAQFHIPGIPPHLHWSSEELKNSLSPCTRRFQSRLRILQTLDNVFSWTFLYLNANRVITCA
jgi:hypothetical protein